MTSVLACGPVIDRTVKKKPVILAKKLSFSRWSRPLSVTPGSFLRHVWREWRLTLQKQRLIIHCNPTIRMIWACFSPMTTALIFICHSRFYFILFTVPLLYQVKRIITDFLFIFFSFLLLLPVPCLHHQVKNEHDEPLTRSTYWTRFACLLNAGDKRSTGKMERQLLNNVAEDGEQHLDLKVVDFNISCVHSKWPLQTNRPTDDIIGILRCGVKWRGSQMPKARDTPAGTANDGNSYTCRQVQRQNNGSM